MGRFFGRTIYLVASKKPLPSYPSIIVDSAYSPMDLSVSSRENRVNHCQASMYFCLAGWLVWFNVVWRGRLTASAHDISLFRRITCNLASNSSRLYLEYAESSHSLLTLTTLTWGLKKKK